jgi:hypothetical protein
VLCQGPERSHHQARQKEKLCQVVLISSFSFSFVFFPPWAHHQARQNELLCQVDIFFFSFVFCISLSTEWSHHEAQTTGKARCVGLNHAI